MDYVMYALNKHPIERDTPWMYRFNTPEKACEIINNAIKGIKDEDTECHIDEHYTEYRSKDTFISLSIPGNMEKPYGPYGTTINIRCPENKDKKCVLITTIEKILQDEITREKLKVIESNKEKPSKQKKEYIKRLARLSRALLYAR